MRTQLRLTQTALAKRAECTDQYIRRLEHGTVSGPSGSVTRAIYEYAAAQDKLQLLAQACRREAIIAGSKNQDPTKFQAFVEDWWAAWVKSVRRNRTAEEMRNVRSVYSLCRYLVLHPYVVQYYAKHKTEMEVSGDILEALSDAGISLVAFEEVLDLVASKGAKE